MAASACFSLGCLTHDMPQRLGDLPANSVQVRVGGMAGGRRTGTAAVHHVSPRHAHWPHPPVQARVLARLMDIEQTRVLQGGGLWDMPPDAVMDMRLPPFVDWDELRMCDGCGR